MEIQVDVVGFEGCPNLAPAVARVREAASLAGRSVAVRTRMLSSEDDPAQFAFLGSPTILVAGRDADPSARTRTDFAFGCRMYGSSGVPPLDMLVASLQEAYEAEESDES